jgi:hypothetical protein
MVSNIFQLEIQMPPNSCPLASKDLLNKGPLLLWWPLTSTNRISRAMRNALLYHKLIKLSILFTGVQQLDKKRAFVLLVIRNSNVSCKNANGIERNPNSNPSRKLKTKEKDKKFIILIIAGISILAFSIMVISRSTSSDG